MKKDFIDVVDSMYEEQYHETGNRPITDKYREHVTRNRPITDKNRDSVTGNQPFRDNYRGHGIGKRSGGFIYLFLPRRMGKIELQTLMHRYILNRNILQGRNHLPVG